jgi:hypothetical protein
MIFIFIKAKEKNGELPTALGLFIAKYTDRNEETGDLQFRSPKSAELYVSLFFLQFLVLSYIHILSHFSFY